MTELDATATDSMCVVCGVFTELPPTIISRLHWELSDSGERVNGPGYPPIWLCPEDQAQFDKDRRIVGWCEGCFAWGREFSVSPCGELFMTWDWKQPLR